MFRGVRVGNSGYIRDMNASAIFQLIDRYGPISRRELAHNTRYSAATITNHVKALLDAGWVMETDKGTSTGGRRPVHIAVNPHKAYIVAVEVEVYRVRLLLFNLSRGAVSRASLPIRPGQGPAQVLPRAVSAARTLLAEAGIALPQLLGIGIAVPGQVSPDGTLVFAPNLGWKRTVVREPFQGVFDCPILIENEARAGGIGARECQYPDVRNLAYVSVKEGIGCGILLQGSVYRGSNSTAGEFGHVPLQPDGRLCHCGGRGCWETLASETALLRAARRVVPGIANGHELLQLAQLEDGRFDEVFSDVGYWLGQGAAALANGIGPDLLVFGGSMARFYRWLRPRLLQAFHAQALPAVRDHVQVEFTHMGDEGTLYGMGALVFRQHAPAMLAGELEAAK